MPTDALPDALPRASELGTRNSELGERVVQRRWTTVRGAEDLLVH